MPDRENAYSSPVLPFDWPWSDGVEIWPCSDCLPWHAELIWPPDDPEALWVREWHAVGCSVWERVRNAADGLS